MKSDISVTDQLVTKNHYLLCMFGCLRISFSHENTDLASRVHATCKWSKIKHLTTFQLLYGQTLETYFRDLGTNRPRKRPGQQNTRKGWAVRYLVCVPNERPSQKAHLITNGFWIKTLTLMGVPKWKVTWNQLL